MNILALRSFRKNKHERSFSSEPKGSYEPIETVVQSYQGADAEERLGLFLSHRDLRDRFMAIEAQENPSRRNQR